MSYIKTFEGFFDLFKSTPKPVEPMTRLKFESEILRVLKPLASDSEFIMDVLRHKNFEVEGAHEGVAYHVLLTHTPFFAGKNEVPALKKAILHNIHEPHNEYLDNGRGVDVETAKVYVQSQVRVALLSMLTSPSLAAGLSEHGAFSAEGIVELGFKYRVAFELLG